MKGLISRLKLELEGNRGGGSMYVRVPLWWLVLVVVSQVGIGVITWIGACDRVKVVYVIIARQASGGSSGACYASEK